MHTLKKSAINSGPKAYFSTPTSFSPARTSSARQRGKASRWCFMSLTLAADPVSYGKPWPHTSGSPTRAVLRYLSYSPSTGPSPPAAARSRPSRLTGIPSARLTYQACEPPTIYRNGRSLSSSCENMYFRIRGCKIKAGWGGMIGRRGCRSRVRLLVWH